MVSAYNSNSVDARNILSSTPRDDILVESMPCIARVEVSSAFFAPVYGNPRGVPAPVMRLVGTVSSVFIEDDDDRVFPCNEKEIQLMSPESVMIEYALSPDEIASMAKKGMFHDPNFEVPANLIGNMIEIPLNITYTGIYDTPCCFVEIISPMELTTSTQDNNYYGLFEACPTSPVIAQMSRGEYVYSEMNVARPTIEPNFQEFVPQPEEEQEVDGRSDEEREDDDIFDKVNRGITGVAEQSEVRRASVDPKKVAQEVLYPAQEDYREKADAEKQAADNSYKLYDFAEDEQAKRQSLPTVSPEKRASNIYDMLRSRAKKRDEEAGSPVEEEKKTGFADESGNGELQREDGMEQAEGSEGFEDYADAPMVDGDLESELNSDDPEVRARAQAKKQRLLAARYDIGVDLAAINSAPAGAVVDTAGHGATVVQPEEGKKPTVPSGGGAAMAQQWLANIRAKREQQAAEVQQSVEQGRTDDAGRDAPQGGGQFL